MFDSNDIYWADGGAAFPTVYLEPVIKGIHSEDSGKKIRYEFGALRNEGMTLRDYLVGQCLSNPETGVDWAEARVDEYLRRRAERIEKLKREAEGGNDEQP